jgi:hypothetical protein
MVAEGRFGGLPKGSQDTMYLQIGSGRQGSRTPNLCRAAPFGQEGGCAGRPATTYCAGEAAGTGMNLKLGVIHKYRFRVPGNSKSP